MTERFLRARSRLSKNEQVLQESRLRSRKLGQTLPEEKVKVPQIGEWELKQNSPKTRTLLDQSKKIVAPNRAQSQFKGRQVQPFPQDIKLSEEQKQRIQNPEQELIQPENAKPVNEAPLRFISPMKQMRKTSPPKHSNAKFPISTTKLDNILATKYRPAKPLPPLKDPKIADDSIPFLPLELFDDTTYEEFSLEYLLEHPKAWSKYNDMENQENEWRECNVVGYDPKTFYFTIEWKNSKKRKKVARFNLRFDVENIDKFNERIEAAKRASLRYEMQFRFNARVESMPIDDLPELSPQNLQKIVIMMNIPRDIRYEGLVNDLIDEICDKFKEMNNKFQFEFDLEHNQLIPNREDFLPLIQTEKRTVNYGLVDNISTHYFQSLSQLANKHLKANPHVLEGLQTIWSIFMNSENLRFLDGKFEDILELNDFIKKQTDVLEATTKKFKGSIQETLENAIQSAVHDDSIGTDQEDKMKLKKLVILTTRMLHTILLNIVENTLESYLSLFRIYLSDNVNKPQFTIYLSFGDSINLSPTVEHFKESILSMLDMLESKVNNLPVIDITLYDVNVGVVSFHDCQQIIRKAKIDLSEILDQLILKLTEFIKKYSHLESCLSLKSDTFTQEFDPRGKRTLDEYRQQLKDFGSVLDIVQNDMRPHYIVSIFYVDCVDFKEKGLQHARELVSALLNQMKSFAVSDLHDLFNDFNNINERIKVATQTPEELASLKQFMNDVVAKTKQREAKMKSAMERFTFLEEFKFEISNEECQEKYQILQMPHKLKLMVEETNRTMQVEKIKMICELRQNQRQLESDSLAVTEMLPSFVSKYQDLEMTVDAVDEINEIQVKLQKLRSAQEKYISHEKLFEFEPTPCKILHKLVDEFNPLHILWNLAGEWLSMNTTWLDTPFPQVRADAMNAFLIQATKKINKLKKDLTPHKGLIEKVLNPLIEQIEKFKQQIPLVAKLRHPGIKTKHWEKISEIVGFHVASSMDLTLQDFLALNLGRWNDEISEIANKAANEYNIESSLDQMDNELQTQQFNTKEFRDTQQYILVEVDEIISLIDDQLVTTQTLLTSPFIAPNKKRALERLSFLRFCHETLDQWVECQRG
ncbi:hypothetical protein TRFO_17306 [Tritrichomonas foetus]|uniref:Dynein heavy chain linker domain-containing protein n=1 Tax=Tritrichomonas foetus TaxID=1144522 RepID=A0A1J4KN69_9EUKA|nr:hypothetical protein TRFO_17306 [Tritrichomonas foetus]|eukprot:OHT12761.1 hypothetical protein TRFO_17306 [Tritrichomonas foetus]